MQYISMIKFAQNATHFGSPNEHITALLANNAFQEWIIIALGHFAVLDLEIINHFYYYLFIY